jgi:hypothetical protein
MFEENPPPEIQWINMGIIHYLETRSKLTILLAHESEGD